MMALQITATVGSSSRAPESQRRTVDGSTSNNPAKPTCERPLAAIACRSRSRTSHPTKREAGVLQRGVLRLANTASVEADAIRPANQFNVANTRSVAANDMKQAVHNVSFVDASKIVPMALGAQGGVKVPFRGLKQHGDAYAEVSR